MFKLFKDVKRLFRVWQKIKASFKDTDKDGKVELEEVLSQLEKYAVMIPSLVGFFSHLVEDLNDGKLSGPERSARMKDFWSMVEKAAEVAKQE